MPKPAKGKATIRADTPSSEIDELADDPALQPQPPADPTRLAKPTRKRFAQGTTSKAAKPQTTKTAGKGTSGVRKRTKSASRDPGEEQEATASASTVGDAGARLARFRYTGPSAGSHQRIDPTTLSDSMASSDPAGLSPASKKRARPPKIAPAHDSLEASPSSPPQPKRKKRTLSAKNGENETTVKQAAPLQVEREPVFVMPEFDEDGNLIEDENADDTPACPTVVSPEAQLGTTAATPSPNNSASGLRSPTKASPAAAAALSYSSPAHRPPSSIELPNALAQRIYQGSPYKHPVGASPSRSAQGSPAKPTPQNPDISPQKRPSPFRPASVTLAPLQTPRKVFEPAIPAAGPKTSPFGPAANQPAATPSKSLSTADLLAVAEVLGDLEDQAFDDDDDVLEALTEERKEDALGDAISAANAAGPRSTKDASEPTQQGSVAPAAACETAMAEKPSIANAAAFAATPVEPEPQTAQTASYSSQQRGLSSTAHQTKPRFDPKPVRLPPSPPKRPPSYRLVANSVEGAISHLRNIVADATEQHEGRRDHEIDFIRAEVSRLADELESRDAAIGELSDEVRQLHKQLGEARRREEGWAREREGWESERREWEMRVDVLKEIRRGLLDELNELRAALATDAGSGDEVDVDEAMSAHAVDEEDTPASLDAQEVEEPMKEVVDGAGVAGEDPLGATTVTAPLVEGGPALAPPAHPTTTGRDDEVQTPT
ncbi:hypothetical protein JCM10908_000267 [Rhodotorula pacifica]|uniref:uncharacterized protein n=1 Tax=Rhodotorula pacifica TaxID=1495444 RepID=UPI00316DC3A1